MWCFSEARLSPDLKLLGVFNFLFTKSALKSANRPWWMSETSSSSRLVKEVAVSKVQPATEDWRSLCFSVSTAWECRDFIIWGFLALQVSLLPLGNVTTRYRSQSNFLGENFTLYLLFVLFQEIFIQGNLIILGAGFNDHLSVPVLFEETFYNEKEESFSILCIAHPLEKIESSSMYWCQFGGCLCTVSKLVFDVLNKCVHSEKCWLG